MVDLIIQQNIATILAFSEECTCGNTVIDDFIRYTHSQRYSKMEFVPYEKFKDVKFLAKGGFSEIYKAIWIDGPRNWNAPFHYRDGEMTVALKELNNSKNIDSKELNEV